MKNNVMSNAAGNLTIEPMRTNFLTPKECAEQFRMYAKSNADKPDAVHQLSFCANFLDEFCVQGGTEDTELMWRYHNDAPFRQFVDRVVAEEFAAYEERHAR